MSVLDHMRLGVFPVGFNYRVDSALDNMLRTALKYGVKTIHGHDEYYCGVEFKDGTYVMFWNVNKYHAWMSRGYIKGPKGEHHWEGGRPSSATMVKLRQALNSY